MIGRDGLDEADRYGALPWVVGTLATLVMVFLMFYWSKGHY